MPRPEANLVEFKIHFILSAGLVSVSLTAGSLLTLVGLHQ